jgi:hypothetical protein
MNDVMEQDDSMGALYLRHFDIQTEIWYNSTMKGFS